MDPTEEGVEVELIAQARALHAYVPTPSDEDQSLVFLPFNKGDIIDVIEMHESGWWEGCCNDAIGLFPGSYVEITERFLSSKEAASDERSSGGEDKKKEEDAAARRVAEEEAAKKEAAKKAQEEADAKKAQEEAAAAKKAAEEERKRAEEAKKVAPVVAQEVKEPATDPTEQLFEARRFALFFKSALDAKEAEFVALSERNAALEVELEKTKAQLDEERKKPAGGGVDEAALNQERALRAAAEASLAEAKQQLEKAAVAPAASSGQDETLVAELKLAKGQRLELQKKVESMDMELKESLDKIGELQKQLAAAPAGGGGSGGSDVAAELKLAKGQRMELQKRVDALDMELREAKDSANELKAQLEQAKKNAAAPPAPVELTDTAVLQAELKMAKQQRMQLQQKVDSMDMELREAMDKAAEVTSLTKQLEEAKAKLAGGGGGGGGGDAAGGGGASAAELEEEKNKRVKLENALKETKKELEEAKKAGGSSSILAIKLQAMEKELAKARTALEAAKAGPAAQLEEQAKEIKELKDKSRKLESELDVALSRAASNEEAMQQKKELRAQLDELREQLEKGKDPVENKATNPKYKIEKLEKENQELREKLLSLQSAESQASGAFSNTPVGSPMVKRAHPPVKKLAPPPISSGGGGGGGEAVASNSNEVAELQVELAKRSERIRELEAAAASAASAAASAAPVSSGPKKLVSMDTQVHSELREAQVLLAKRDAQISELEGRLRDTISQLSRAGIDTSASISGSAQPSGPAAPGGSAPLAKAPVKKMFVKKVAGGVQPGAAAPKGAPAKVPMAAPPKTVPPPATAE